MPNCAFCWRHDVPGSKIQTLQTPCSYSTQSHAVRSITCWAAPCFASIIVSLIIRHNLSEAYESRRLPPAFGGCWWQAGGGILVGHQAAATAHETGGQSYRAGETGLDSVEFLLAAGPAEPLRALGSIASGGESARIMMALKAAPSAAAAARDRMASIRASRASCRHVLYSHTSPYVLSECRLCLSSRLLRRCMQYATAAKGTIRMHFLLFVKRKLIHLSQNRRLLLFQLLLEEVVFPYRRTLYNGGISHTRPVSSVLL